MEPISQEDVLFNDFSSAIALRLNFIEAKIKTDNRLNFTDNNIKAEKYFEGLFNLIYGYKLKNLNKQRKNTPGIDLGDKKTKVCYQVTSTNERKKIDESIKKFEKYEWDKDYDTLNIFIIGTKKKYRKLPPCNSKLEIIDIPGIREEIDDLPLEKQIDIWTYVKLHNPLPDIDDAYQTVILKKSTYSIFLKEYFISEYRKTAKKIINQLAEELSEFDITTRTLIYVILMKSVIVDGMGVSFSFYEISKKLKWSEDTLIKELNILKREGWIDVNFIMDTEDEIYGITDIEYYTRDLVCLSYSKDGNEWFSMMYDFLKSKSKNKKRFDEYMEKLILDLNFKVLN